MSKVGYFIWSFESPHDRIGTYNDNRVSVVMKEVLIYSSEGRSLTDYSFQQCGSVPTEFNDTHKEGDSRFTHQKEV